jgi:uncharacterized protein YeaO (DUF488 family)
MAIRIVRLGDPRAAGEGLRIGTVRFLPRGVPKAEYATRNYFDLWFPILAPSAEAIREAKAAGSDRDWARFVRKYRKEMSAPGPRSVLDLLAALSEGTDLSVGCYCADETLCHRSVLRELLAERGAKILV